jgi:hypothetical protein
MKALILGLALVVALLAAGCTGTGTGGASAPTSPGAGEVNSTLALFADGTAALLNGTDANVSAAAAALGRTGLSGPTAQAVLLDLSRTAAFVVDAVTYDVGGRAVAVEPSPYGSIVGTSLAGPTAPPDFYRETYLGPYGELAEGFRGIALGHPVTGPDGTVIGGVSVALRPELMLREPADAARRGTTVALYAVETDGTIIYADDPAIVGGPASQPGTGLAGMASQIEESRSGVSVHRPATAGTDRAVAWTTVSLHGTEWRLVAAQL